LLWKLLFLMCLAVVAGTPVAAAEDDQDQPTAAGPALAAEVAPGQSRQRSVLAEAVKQAAEQPLHFAVSAAPIWLSRCLTAVPWYGWAVVPALAYREWRQWPSQRWWDPALDAGFLVLGVVVATWSRTVPGSSALAALRRQRWRAASRRPATFIHPLPTEHPSA
jgi:hypothetical protein